MKKQLAFLLLALTFAVPTFAQGKVAVDVVKGTYHWVATFGTSSQFKAWKRKREALYADKHTNHQSEAEAQSWHTQDYCEADGFKWHDGGCHAK